MSTTTTPTLDPRAARSAPDVNTVRPSTAKARHARGRTMTLLIMLVSFIATAVLQNVTQARHHTMVLNTGSESKLSNLNSFSLALLLGGLRGPLVMMLWTSSESQKQERDLEDFDSKIELIRLLQPEFDSVHIFQMWNKAYNISVQMANKPNKYVAILDAIEYGYKIEQQRANNINIESQLGQLFFDKLGNSSEKDYYIDRVRRETFPDVRVTVPAERRAELEAIFTKAGVEAARRDVMLQQASRNGWFIGGKLAVDAIRPLLSGPGVTYELAEPQVMSDTGRRLRLDPMLDLDGNLLPRCITPTSPRPANLPADSEWNDGSELQYLKGFAPFPYGIHPMAIGWNYFKKCQVLKDVMHQKHLQLGDTVMDTRPAIDLRLWGESEWGMGRRAEAQAFGQALPTMENATEVRWAMETQTADVPPTAAPVNPALAQEAVYRYDLVARLSDASEREYDRHRRHNAGAEFRNHRQTMAAMKAICLADRDYLKAILLPAGDQARRKALLAEATRGYQRALQEWQAVTLEYYVADELFQSFTKTFAPGVTKDNLLTIPPNQLNQMTAALMQTLNERREYDTNSDERHESERYIRRAYARLGLLGAAPK